MYVDIEIVGVCFLEGNVLDFILYFQLNKSKLYNMIVTSQLRNQPLAVKNIKIKTHPKPTSLVNISGTMIHFTSLYQSRGSQ